MTDAVIETVRGIDVVIPQLDPRPWTNEWLWARGPSRHLSWKKELDCKDGTPYPMEWRRTKAVWLATEFEIIRATARRGPIKIGSGYRTEEHNKDSKGARNSRHVLGEALDTYTPGDMALIDYLDIVIAVAHREGGRIRGIGVYPWGVHIDVRPGTRIARWKGKRTAPELWNKLAAEA